jgi:uncharacterized protein YecT (DUF1311 family)
MKTLLIILCLSFLSLSDGQPVPSVEALSPTEEALRWAGEYERADAEMNKVYKKLLGSGDSVRGKRLRAAQRAWIAFRDAEAEFVREDWKGGTGQTAAVNSVLATLTRDRVRQLRERL